MERLTQKGFDFTTNYVKRNIDSWSIAQCLKRLQEYEDAEEQGLLIKLPCKVGDSIYQPIRKEVNEYKVIGLCYDITKKKWLFEVACQLGLEWIKTICKFEAIGKTVFLTKAEAEQALKQMGE